MRKDYQAGIQTGEMTADEHDGLAAAAYFLKLFSFLPLNLRDYSADIPAPRISRFANTYAELAKISIYEEFTTALVHSGETQGRIGPSYMTMTA